MAVFKEPENVLAFFAEYCKIPHASRHTGAAKDYCLHVARSAGLAASDDAAGNVLIRVPATPGYEEHPTVILQGHLDMVSAREEGCPTDPETDGVVLLRDGDWLRARGTTLGGDDGIAVAMFLAIATDPAVAHPPLEILLTNDEEVGMLGAEAFDTAQLHGRLLLNVDSDAEGILTAGCAGGSTLICSHPVCREMRKGRAYTLTLSGLSGGHSGTMIGEGRLNANHALASFVAGLCDRLPVALLSLAGGEKDNAIPAAATCRFLSDAGDEILRAVQAWEAGLKEQYGTREPGLAVTLVAGDAVTADALTPSAAHAWLSFLAAAPNGVQVMHPTLPGAVEASLNLGVISTAEDRLTATYLVRSSRLATRETVVDAVLQAAAASGVAVVREGDYPPWEYKAVSPLRERMCALYSRMFGSEAKVEVIHAGLECAVFSSRLPDLDAISLGPDMPDIHTPRERVSVSSVARVYQYLLALLREL